MKGKIISQDQGNYFVSGADGKRYQFANRSWSGKKPPKVGDMVDFVCEGDAIKSVFPILTKGRSQKSKVLLAIVCLCLGAFGIHRFMVGKVGTGIVMLFISLIAMLFFIGLIFFGLGFFITIPWALIDFIFILTGNFGKKSTN
ncbi:NINE protein [Bartonella sp. TT29SHDZB]|uniref:TM2 domain-containing protein n=1 Tax=Bartonella sp. TT29SHDZB TaxID=3243581 RepID=UPI0035CFB8E9